MVTIETALRQIPYLQEAPENVRTYLAQHATRFTVDAQQMVVLEGELTNALFIVEKGGLKAVKLSPTGREHVLHFVEAGDTFNEITVLVHSENPVTIMALEESILWRIDANIVWQMIAEQPQTAQIVIQQLARRVQSLLSMIEDLSLRTVEARLARYLLSQASTNDIVMRARWATQAELAKRLGTVPDVLHRAFRTLSLENLIEVERHQITILDRAALQLRSELDK